MIKLTEEQKEIIDKMDDKTKKELNEMIYMFVFLWWLNENTL